MLPYIVLFSLILLLSYFYEKRINKKMSFILFYSILIILSLFAAIRNDEIGRDIITYVKPYSLWMKNMSLFEFLKIGNIEVGYKVLNYIIMIIFNDYHYIMFFVEFIISFGFFKYIKRLKEKYNVSFVLGTFLFLFLVFNDSLVMMRQMISVALILNSFEYLNEKKFLPTFLLFITSFCFHKTSIIALLGYLIILINNNEKSNVKYKNIIYFFIIFVLAFIGIFYKQFLEVLSIVPYFNKINYYLYSDYNLNTAIISKSILIFKIIWVFASYIYLKSKNSDKNKYIYFMYSIIDLVIYLSSLKMIPLMRFGLYFSYPSLFILSSKIKDVFKKDYFNKLVLNICIIFIVLFNWIFNYVINNTSSNTIPYKSDIISNILDK